MYYFHHQVKATFPFSNMENNDLVPHPIPKCRERIEFKCSAYGGVIP